MTSTAQYSFVEPRPKKRRLRGACDICRKQKGVSIINSNPRRKLLTCRQVKCDSSEMPGNVCSRCISFNSECTHSGTSKFKSTSPSPDDLLNSRHTAQEHIDFILAGSQEYVCGDPSALYQVLFAVAQYARRLEEALAPSTAGPSQSSQPGTPSPLTRNVAENDLQGYLIGFNLPESMLPITRVLSSNRFYGESSSMYFIKSVMDIKSEALGEENSKSWARRPEFWHVRPWEIPPPKIYIPHIFPEPDLMETLIDHYFAQINILIYTFHEPSFRSSVARGLHLRDQDFGAVVLVVCALGSKFSDDPRVFLEHADSEHSAGWKWYRQVQPIPHSLAQSPSLYGLQLICLSIMYLVSGSTPEATWALAGLGLHMAYDVGAHRRIRSQEGNTVESEEYKRAFWMLLVSDTAMSSLLGRPRAANLNNIDADPPMALEGEDLNLVIYGQLLLKVTEIWGRVQNEIYPIKRKEQNYQDIVADLDSALNELVDSIPDQLRWDPHRKNLTTLNQSACIYSTFYHVQLLLHRPFIQSPGNSSLSSISFPSLAICANAARSCGHVLDAQVKRNLHPLYNPQTIVVLFDSAIVLLYNVYYRRPAADQSVQKLINVLRAYERRWQTAGRDADIIAGMLDVRGAEGLTSSSLKRPRSATEVPPENEPSSEGPRAVATSAHISSMTQNLEQLEVSDQELERLLFMPLHTEDLGRLPIYEPFDFDSIFRFDAFSDTALNLGLSAESGSNWGSYAPEGSS